MYLQSDFCQFIFKDKLDKNKFKFIFLFTKPIERMISKAERNAITNV